MSAVDRFVKAAAGEVGKPYATHRDCSGFTAWAAREAGVLIPEGSVAQFKVGKPVNSGKGLKPGDLLFWDTFGPSPGHVAIYEGDGKVLHALNEQHGIVRSRVDADMGGPFVGARRLDFPKDAEPVVTAAVDGLGSYGNASIDQWDFAFVAASEAVFRLRAVRVDPRFLKAMMEVESGGDGFYPAARCRPCDGLDCVPACGPMQIKRQNHQWRCPACDFSTVPGQIELAAHIIGMPMKEHGWDEYRSFLAVYFPADDINGTTQQAYVNRLRSLVRAMEQDAGEESPLDPWRPLPFPPMREAIVNKPGEGAGFYRVAARGPRIVGTCNHITDGVPGGDQIESYRRFFSTGGERAWDALTDLVIARDGEAGVLNDWRDPNRGGTRAGWANGTTDGLEGDGIRFFRFYPAINDVLVSIEHVADSSPVSRPFLTDAQLETSIAVSAANAQAVKCPHDAYPYHPGKNGVNIEQRHANFAPKSCPTTHFPYDVKVREVRAILAKHQTGSTNPGEPVPEPPVPEPVFPFGFPREAMDFFWGTLTRHDGREFPFDPAGPLSLLWLARCAEEGKFPESESWSRFGTRDIVQWEGGWTAIRETAHDPNAVWTWLDKGAPAPTIERTAA